VQSAPQRFVAAIDGHTTAERTAIPAKTWEIAFDPMRGEFTVIARRQAA
jgi:hypothetical protein